MPGAEEASGDLGAAGASGAGAEAEAALISSSVAPHLIQTDASGLFIFPHTGHLTGPAKFDSAGLKHMGSLSSNTFQRSFRIT